MTPLPRRFPDRLFAHRELFASGRPENGMSAVQAAAATGFGVEVDVQASSDGVAMMFHDDSLDRMREWTAQVREPGVATPAATPLAGARECIPTLNAVLDALDADVPVLVKIKDQSGCLGATDGQLERATAAPIAGRPNLAVISYNLRSVARIAFLAPELPRGLVTSHFPPREYPGVPLDRLTELTGMPDLDRIGSAFISHDADDLDSPRVAAVPARGRPVVCWTIRSPEAAAGTLC